MTNLLEKTTIPLNAELKLFLDEVNDFNLEVWSDIDIALVSDVFEGIRIKDSSKKEK